MGRAGFESPSTFSGFAALCVVYLTNLTLLILKQLERTEVDFKRSLRAHCGLPSQLQSRDPNVLIGNNPPRVSGVRCGQMGCNLPRHVTSNQHDLQVVPRLLRRTRAAADLPHAPIFTFEPRKMTRHKHLGMNT